MLEVFLALKTLNNGGNSRCVVVKIVHGQINPRYVLGFFAKFAPNLHTKLLHVVVWQVYGPNLLDVKKGQDLFVEVVSDSVFA